MCATKPCSYSCSDTLVKKVDMIDQLKLCRCMCLFSISVTNVKLHYICEGFTEGSQDDKHLKKSNITKQIIFLI